MSIQLSPLNEHQLKALTSLTDGGLNREQLLWINGYFQGLLASSGSNQHVNVSKIKSSKQLKKLYGTHTGRSKTIAGQLAAKLAGRGVEAVSVALDDYKTRQLTSETNVVFIVSTHGEGEPPAMAEDFHGFITGKRAPQLPNLNYSVVALGDESYKLFCKTGIDIDQALTKLGAKTILPILTLDVDFDEEIERWINDFTDTFADTPATSVQSSVSGNALNSETYSRKNPFHATVIEKVKIKSLFIKLYFIHESKNIDD